jgi:protein-L-isoaspartate(D-aspartate) O-methyltransferase
MKSMVTKQIVARGVRDKRVLAAVSKVPRHEFVPENETDGAYEDRPLPIGFGQTISQPYVVAFMTEKLGLRAEDRVLEIGTGSGYQTAILAETAGEVYTIEIIPELAKEVGDRFARLGYDRIHLKVGDGYFGWADEGPFDAILVTAAAERVPPPLIEQLKPGGRLIIPIGGEFSIQNLILIEKNTDGSTVQKELLSVRFVPMTGESRRP